MNTFQKQLMGIAAGLTTAATAFGQVTVTAPPVNSAGPTNIQAGPVNVQSGPYGTSVTIPPGTAAPLLERMRDNAAIRQGERQAARDDWRMRNYNGQWWYWNPNNSWSVYRNNAWVPYSGANAQRGMSAPPVPNAQPLAPAGAQTTTSAPSVVVRRGPLGLRRYSVGYRGYTTATPAAPATNPKPNVPTPATPPSNP